MSIEEKVVLLFHKRYIPYSKLTELGIDVAKLNSYLLDNKIGNIEYHSQTTLLILFDNYLQFQLDTNAEFNVNQFTHLSTHNMYITIYIDIKNHLRFDFKMKLPLYTFLNLIYLD